MKIDFEKSRGAKRYVNVTSEGPPRLPGDPRTQEQVLEAYDEEDDNLTSEEEPEPQRTPTEQDQSQYDARVDLDPPDRNVRPRIDSGPSSTPLQPAPEPVPHSSTASAASSSFHLFFLSGPDYAGSACRLGCRCSTC